MQKSGWPDFWFIHVFAFPAPQGGHDESFFAP
jgi:hypothetical protein